LKAHVLKLDITDAVLPDDRVRASGVVFVCDGEQYEVKVKKEILLCAGTSELFVKEQRKLKLESLAGSFQTPQILEVSGALASYLLFIHLLTGFTMAGIGNPAILAQHNIPLKVPLPSVGENLQVLSFFHVRDAQDDN
jgi:hypothetical protein